MLCYTSLSYVNFNDHLKLFLYLILMCSILSVFFCFIFFQVFQSVKLELFFYQLKSKEEKLYSVDELFDALKILIEKRLWFKAVKLIESVTNVPVDKMHQYFNALGFIYYSMNQYDLARLYYLKALDVKHNYIIALQNLAKVYEKNKNYALVLSVYKSILKYDSTNKIAQQYMRRSSMSNV